MMLGVIGISFLIVMSFEAQANTLESMSTSVSEEVYHHDLKVSGSLYYASIGDEFGVLDEDSFSDLDECDPGEARLYTDVGGDINVAPFFDGEEYSCSDSMRDYLLVTAILEEDGDEDFARIEVGEE